MSKTIKSQGDILEKLQIAELNPMQEEAQLAITTCSEVVLLSPTGTGKTLAFLLPIISELDAESEEIQVLILVPSRELAIQIEQVVREMGTGFKTNAAYGGRPFSKDKMQLKHRPAILIGTPGRVADHIRRRTFSTNFIKTLVLDEFDKSLEVGFEKEMDEILTALRRVEKKVLTSATQGVEIPAFVGLKNPASVNYLEDGVKKLTIKAIISPSKDKLETLVKALAHLKNQPGIVFCNYKNSIERVSNYLTENGINHGCFHGGMEQHDRERALIQFRNGTYQTILATDLAARGIDISELKYILHYHLPTKSHEFVHRNGRTARMNSEGIAYVLKWEEEELPDFIGKLETENLEERPLPKKSEWATVFVSGGRKDKISKGDIAGLFFQQGELKNDEVGIIELKNDCSFVAVKADRVKHLIKMTDNTRLKKKKVRVSLVE